MSIPKKTPFPQILKGRGTNGYLGWFLANHDLQSPSAPQLHVSHCKVHGSILALLTYSLTLTFSNSWASFPLPLATHCPCNPAILAMLSRIGSPLPSAVSLILSLKLPHLSVSLPHLCSSVFSWILCLPFPLFLLLSWLCPICWPFSAYYFFTLLCTLSDDSDCSLVHI